MRGRFRRRCRPQRAAHLTHDNAVLLRAVARGVQRLRVTSAAQLNGTPHIGTVVTVLSVFAPAAHAAGVLGLPATVILDALDNAPAEQVEIDGETDTRTVSDLIDSGHLDRRPAARCPHAAGGVRSPGAAHRGASAAPGRGRVTTGR